MRSIERLKIFLDDQERYDFLELTGYAECFDSRHKRHGHRFQNRYKSILCQENPYRLEPVHDPHLNPLRAKGVADMDAFGKYPFYVHGGNAFNRGMILSNRLLKNGA